MIAISLYTYPSPASSSGKRELQVEAEPGKTVREIFESMAVGTPDYYVVMINGYGAGLDSTVADGDQLVLFPAISGG
jgi:molybdopterin converting factor small subunit